MVLSNFQSRDFLLICLIVGQGPTVHAVGAGSGWVEYFFSLFFLPLSGSI